MTVRCSSGRALREGEGGAQSATVALLETRKLSMSFGGLQAIAMLDAIAG